MAIVARQNSELSKPPIWWSNTLFFISVHFIGIYGALFISPIHRVSKTTLLVSFLSWQLATFGITIGYHRLWSHRAFKASEGLRWALSLMACLGFQGSIKWWVLRHRLHHRWTDTEFDPYNAKKGLFYSHMGWIFRKPRYEKMARIDRSDLDRDRVVQFQHRYYLPLSFTLGFVIPHLLTNYILKSNQNSCLDGLIWAGFISRLLIWHFTFFINSLAHYLGDQLFDLDITARSNFWLAIFTGGEANHNYHHVFPKDYRNGPATLDWDPTKWIIYLLYRFTPWVTRLYSAEPEEVELARKRVLELTSRNATESQPSSFEDIKEIRLISSSSDSESEPESVELLGSRPVNRIKRLPRWKKKDVIDRLQQIDSCQPIEKSVLLLINGFLVDCTKYCKSGSHPGGIQLLRNHAIHLKSESPTEIDWKDSTQTFFFDFNQHSWPARRKMEEMRIARLIE